jgi:Sortase domain
VTTVPGDGASPGQRAVAGGRLDDWWDPAWDAAWWDPAWNADRPADAPAPAAAAGQRGGAALVEDSAEPGILASLPDASPDHVARPPAAVPGWPAAVPAGPAVAVPAVQAVAVPAEPAVAVSAEQAVAVPAGPAVAVPAVQAVAVPAEPVVVPRTPPTAAAAPSWGQVLATTVSLWVSRRRPQAGITGMPSAARVSAAPVPGVLARRPRLAAWGGAVPVRLLAASMLGAGLLAVAAGTAGLLAASGSPAAPVRWAARPSPLPVPSARTVASAVLATAQQTARPVWLAVPAIGVRTRLVDLGLNRNGTLQVPTSTTVAGWFTGSPRPGAVGPAVIAGHVDSRTGPAIFFWLRTLRPGERIYVGRADGTMAVFTVTSVRFYSKDEFPTAAVYGPVPDAELRLITCGGIFDGSLGSYLSNVVVFARLTG